MIKKYSLLSILGLVLIAGCSSQKTEKEHPSMLVINVLDEVHYNDAHIKGSINVPMMNLKEYMDDIKKADQKNMQIPVVIYCSNYACGASSAAAKQLQKMGFDHVWAYEGGMAEWYQLNFPQGDYNLVAKVEYPFEGSAKNEYLKAPNPKTEIGAEADVPVISAQELRKMMQEHSLLPANAAA